MFDSTRTQPQTPYHGLRLLILGATGAVGQEVLAQAQSDYSFVHICAPTRKPLKQAVSARFDNPVVDFDRLDPDALWWQADALICTLGTTLRKAGSADAFVAIERDLVLQLSALALHAGVKRCAYVSSLGASEGGNLYLRTKAETEAGLSSLGFHSLCVVRPSLIDTRRTESRPTEQLSLAFSRLLAPVLPAKWKPVTPAQIAHALLSSVKAGTSGTTLMHSEALWSPKQPSQRRS